MKVVSSPRYAIDIGPHVFPTEKYRRIYDRLLATPRPGLEGIIAPQAAAWDELALVHTAEYLEKVRTLCLSSEEIVELQLPLNAPIVEGFRLMTGGTLTAARLGLADGLACHVGGGFHHAFANHGEGFCLFNDVVVAIEVLRLANELLGFWADNTTVNLAVWTGLNDGLVGLRSGNAWPDIDSYDRDDVRDGSGWTHS